MEYVIGVTAAVGVGLFGTMIGFDKERSFYPVVLIVIAALYLLFAVMAKSTGSLVTEAIPALVFVAMAALGFRKTHGSWSPDWHFTAFLTSFIPQ